ncbi:hypothetical protein D3C85_954470 [compost metagenome]
MPALVRAAPCAASAALARVPATVSITWLMVDCSLSRKLLNHFASSPISSSRRRSMRWVRSPSPLAMSLRRATTVRMGATMRRAISQMQSRARAEMAPPISSWVATLRWDWVSSSSCSCRAEASTTVRGSSM